VAVKRLGRSGLNLGAAIVGGIGLVFLAAGLALFILGTRSADTEHARIETLRPSDAAAFTALTPGSAVLVEGRIGASQPVLFRDFVAYERMERDVPRSTDDKQAWSTREKKTPALRIDIPGGRVWVLEPYRLSGVASWRDPAVAGGRESVYSGLRAGETVMVVGRVGERPAVAWSSDPTRGIEADLVTPGDRRRYLESLASGRSVSRLLGGLFVGLGVLMSGIALALLVRDRRRHA
jgi:hypothetical protein